MTGVKKTTDSVEGYTMRPKVVCKTAIDLAMTVGLLTQMAYLIVGQELHEWLGVGMFLLFIAHNLLNIGWYKNLLRGKYTPFRITLTAVSLAVLSCMVGLMVSGIMMSRYVFDFLQISGGMSFARTLHMLAAYWGFVLMSLHLGLHWDMVARHLPRTRHFLMQTAALLIAAYGVFGFIKHDIASYLFLKIEFAFFDPNQSALLFFAEYLAMMGLYICAAHYTAKLLRQPSKRNQPKE